MICRRARIRAIELKRNNSHGMITRTGGQKDGGRLLIVRILSAADVAERTPRSLEKIGKMEIVRPRLSRKHPFSRLRVSSVADYYAKAWDEFSNLVAVLQLEWLLLFSKVLTNH